jgi:hypothetical protein
VGGDENFLPGVDRSVRLLLSSDLETETVDVEKRNLLLLRLLMCLGVFLLLADLVERQSLGLKVPWLISFYLISSSLYFAKCAQKMVLGRREEVLTYFLFPGAFITALVPAYTLFLFLISTKI